MSADLTKHVDMTGLCKMFSLKTGWPLPNPDEMFTRPQWKLDEFQELKTVLNGTKQKLNCFDLNQWHAHTNKMNPAGYVINHVRKHIRPDFLTQAWCKFYEIMCSSLLFPREAIDKNRLFTVHLCEAPGAFISSLNHYLAINHEQLHLEWLAMTLNPYHEANGHPHIVSDDRLILNTLDNWEFGPDYTGDIFQTGYVEHLYQTVQQRFNGDVCLVTADGSIDCSDDPGEQENVVMRLLNYECMAALNVLQNSGSFVLKMFTTFECNTICRTYLLCCLFQSVVFRKPVTSKPGNSEVYAVCTGYKGRSLALPFVVKFFLDDHRNDEAALLPLTCIPSSFRTQLLECSKYFTDLQIQMIENNIDALLPDRKEQCYREIEELQWSVCQKFIAKYNLRPICLNQELMSHKFKSKVRINCRRRELCYADKIRLRHLDLVQEADILYREVMNCNEWKKPCLREIIWGKRENLSITLSDVQFRLGKPVVTIKGSKFCSESLIHFRVQVFSKFPQTKSKVDADSRSLFYRLKLDCSNMYVCDLTEICVENSYNNNLLQYNCITSIINKLHTLNSMDDLLLIGYTLYTQMSVACFFAIASMFETYGLLRPNNEYGHAFVFFNYKKHEGWLTALEKAKSYLLPESNKNFALVSWLPIKVLLEQNVYSDIVTLNNLCIVHEIEPMLSDFLDSNAKD